MWIWPRMVSCQKGVGQIVCCLYTRFHLVFLYFIFCCCCCCSHFIHSLDISGSYLVGMLFAQLNHLICRLSSSTLSLVHTYIAYHTGNSFQPFTNVHLYIGISKNAYISTLLLLQWLRATDILLHQYMNHNIIQKITKKNLFNVVEFCRNAYTNTLTKRTQFER